MAKRVDQDSTMEVSTSQLVPNAPKVPARAPQRPSAPVQNQNDVSTWGQVVVGTDQFAPPPKKKRRGLVIGLVAFGVAVVGVVVYVLVSPGPAPSSGSAGSALALSSGSSNPEIAKSPVEPVTKITPDAMPAVDAADATTDAATSDVEAASLAPVVARIGGMAASIRDAFGAVFGRLAHMKPKLVTKAGVTKKAAITKKPVTKKPVVKKPPHK